MDCATLFALFTVTLSVLNYLLILVCRPSSVTLAAGKKQSSAYFTVKNN